MSIVAESNDCEKVAGLVKVNEGEVREYLGNMVRDSVEETLNGLLEAEADELCGAKRYERSVGAAGHAGRALRAEAADQGGRGDVEGAPAAEPAV